MSEYNLHKWERGNSMTSFLYSWIGDLLFIHIIINILLVPRLHCLFINIIAWACVLARPCTHVFICVCTRSHTYNCAIARVELSKGSLWFFMIYSGILIFPVCLCIFCVILKIIFMKWVYLYIKMLCVNALANFS